MIIRTEDLKAICSKVLFAINNGTSDYAETADIMQLKTEDNYLHVYVTNREYFVDIKIEMFEKENFNVTIPAESFLKLVSNTSSESIELILNNNVLEIVCDGKYSIPIIMDGSEDGKMLELPKLSISNVTQELNVPSSSLNSILSYNSREINKGIISSNQAQRMYYVDEHGAITFSNGACVNTFELEKPISILLPQKVVKLFKLFKDGNVKFSIGYDTVDNSEFSQMKVSFDDGTISVVAILPLGDTLIKSVPVDAIRKRAFDDYSFSVSVNRNHLLNLINRMSIFSNFEEDITPYIFEFSSDCLTISNTNKTNTEDIYYDSTVDHLDKYVCRMYLFDLKSALESYKNENIVLKFGNGQSVVLVHGNIYNIIPECTE